MPLVSDFWRIIKRRARVVLSLEMHWMAWIWDEDETDIWNFDHFGRFVPMRRK